MRSAFCWFLCFSVMGCIGDGMDPRAIPAPSQQVQNSGFHPQSEAGSPSHQANGVDAHSSGETDSPSLHAEAAPDQPEHNEEAPITEKKDAESHTSSAPLVATTSIAFVSPLAGKHSNPVLLMVATKGPVVRVKYQADDLWSDQVWPIGESTAAAGGFATYYSFSQGGQRTLRALGLDGSGTVIAEVSISVSIEVEESSVTPAPAAPATPAPPASSSTCAAGEIQDCDGACAPKDWIHDGTCDNGTGDTANFLCPALGMDGDDCGLEGQAICAVGEIIDCLGSCAKASWINDGICDDGSQYSTVFTCEELGFDGTDCDKPASTPSAPSPTPSPETTTNPPAAPSAVPYFYQYDNKLYPGSSCQNTSVAMVLASVGWGGAPDEITAAWGKDYAQSPAGLAGVFNHYAKAMGITERLIPHTNGSITGLQALLSAGKPVIVHGYFTSAGHVLVVTDYDGTSYTVHDPAGQWNQQFKGGYSGYSSTAGKNVVYSKAAFELAISSLNGSNYAPLWYHELTD